MYYNNKVINITKNFDVNIQVNTAELTLGIVWGYNRGDGFWFGIALPTVQITFGVWFKGGPSAR